MRQQGEMANIRHMEILNRDILDVQTKLNDATIKLRDQE